MLFITYRKPYHAASIDTRQIWIKEILAETNLIKNFTPHSCRSASTTKAFNMSLDILDVLRKACWSNAIKEIIRYKGEGFNKIMEY